MQMILNFWCLVFQVDVEGGLRVQWSWQVIIFSNRNPNEQIHFIHFSNSEEIELEAFL